MANIQINIIENGTTTLATSGCICDRNIDINVDVPVGTACDGRHIPEDALTLTGDCQYLFMDDKWAWFIRDYGNEITTHDITQISTMFEGSKSIIDIPFDLNCSDKDTVSASSVFYDCNNLTHIGAIRNAIFYYFQSVFTNCYKLRYLPEFENCDFTSISRAPNAFTNCYSLRSIPENVLKDFNCSASTSTYHLFGNLCGNCYALDELKSVNPMAGRTYTSNIWTTDALKYCFRLQDFTFATQEDGTPYTVNWKNQTIDLSNYVGYARGTSYILNYNSGITADKEVKDDATYQALKNDPDWFTTDVRYSRYNHDSAVNTINSLPDCSAYIGTSGATNTIKFKGDSGSLTDGGAINTLTEDEIAVATAKGWTVTIV